LWGDFDREWKSYQRTFNNLDYQKTLAKYDELKKVEIAKSSDNPDLRKLEKRLASIKQRPYKIQQVLLPELGKVDRCISCHLGSTRADFKQEPHPYRTHPEPYLKHHPPERFGCTLCHLGQGMATTLKAAHGEVAHWLDPLVKEEYLQSACEACHELGQSLGERFFIKGRKVYHTNLELPFAPALSEGRYLFEELGCPGCHAAPGYNNLKDIGPSLAKIGSKVKEEWLFKWLKDPKAYLSKAKMPNFLLPDEEAWAMTKYLMTSRDEDIVPGKLLRESGDDLYEKGKLLFESSRCVTCHSINGVGGPIGPELGDIVSKIKKDWLISWLKDPMRYYPHTKMPRFAFTDDQIAGLVKYIFTEYHKPDGAGREILPWKPVDSPELINKGKILIQEYRCMGCHEIKGVEKKGEIAPDLSNIGSKTIEDIDFGETDIPRTVTDYISTKIKTPRIFGEQLNLKMPFYRLDDEQVRLLTTVLLGFRDKEIPESYKIVANPSKVYTPQGDAGRLIDKHKCLTCHQIHDKGGDLAPNLSLEGSQVKEEWLHQFLMNPYIIRPELGIAMPHLGISDKDVKILASYILIVLVDDGIQEVALSEDKIPEELLQKGRELYYDTYECQTCHQRGSDEGETVGPNLTNVRLRLKPGWIFTWLKDPELYKPEAGMPDFDISDEESIAITAFLIAQDQAN
jgi:mono/diheme cytochrome c family protein